MCVGSQSSAAPAMKCSSVARDCCESRSPKVAETSVRAKCIGMCRISADTSGGSVGSACRAKRSPANTALLVAAWSCTITVSEVIRAINDSDSLLYLLDGPHLHDGPRVEKESQLLRVVPEGRTAEVIRTI